MLLAAFACLWFGSGCGQPPVPIDPKSGEVLDPKYRPETGPEQVAGKQVSGTIRLRGELADAEVGTVYVILRERGSRMPARMRSYVYGGVEISDPKDGERRLQFTITERDVLPGMEAPLPKQPELRVLYSKTGSVGGGGPQIAKEVPVNYGDEQVEIALP